MMLRLVDLFGYLSVVFRAGTLIFQSLLLGGVSFLLWVALPAPDMPSSGLTTVRCSLLRLLRISAIGLAVAQVLSLYVGSAVLMTTAAIGFRDVIGANFFVAGSCMLLAAICAFFATWSAKRIRSLVLPILAAIVLSGSVMTNHAAARVSGRPLLIAITSLHEAAAGFWIGGLPFLMLALFRAKNRSTQWYLVGRFSRLAVVSVAALLASGLAMSLTYVGSFAAMFGTAYGVMVTAKAVLLGALVALGGINFLLLRSSTPDGAVPKVRRIVEAELGIGITAILAAASLTSQPPAVDLATNTVASRTILARITPNWPRLTYPTPIPASVKGGPLNRAALQPTTVRSIDGGFLSRKALADIQESEANHHWMGLIVLAMGILALLARTGKIKWAEYWPLLLIAISIFILLRGDTESWPYGPQGFWATWLNPEVFQHRLAALACAGFALFELRVRKRSLDSSLALVFPLMCALGGAVLLTHSHSITSVKEELLAELSHVSLGVLAVLAGWSRWLEIRMPAVHRRVPSWIWPTCFVLIAVCLLNYREM